MIASLARSAALALRSAVAVELGREPRKLRVRSFRSGWVGLQVLQERRLWGWRTIDREEIPGDVIISLGCFGDSGGWTSKFARLGTFGRRGEIVPHPAR